MQRDAPGSWELISKLSIFVYRTIFVVFLNTKNFWYIFCVIIYKKIHQKITKNLQKKLRKVWQKLQKKIIKESTKIYKKNPEKQEVEFHKVKNFDFFRFFFWKILTPIPLRWYIFFKIGKNL